MESTLVTSAVIIVFGLALGWIIGSGAWQPLERRLKRVTNRLIKLETHHALILLGSLMMSAPTVLALTTDGIPTEDIYSAFKFSTLTGAGMVGLGVAMWIVQKRRSYRRGPDND